MPIRAVVTHARQDRPEDGSRRTAKSLDGLNGAAYRVARSRAGSRSGGPAPFTTSTLQQEASRKLGYPVRRTMQIAQELYEGVDLGRKVPRV